jgi:hypothetical protein
MRGNLAARLEAKRGIYEMINRNGIHLRSAGREGLFNRKNDCVVWEEVCSRANKSRQNKKGSSTGGFSKPVQMIWQVPFKGFQNLA